MFRLGRRHARLIRWHKVHVGAVNAAIRAVIHVVVSARDKVAEAGPDRVMLRGSRTLRSRSAENKWRGARPFARC